VVVGVEAVTRLDSHVVVWLYVGDLDRLSRQAVHLLESTDLAVSPIVTLELTYLHEIGRLTVPGPTIVDELTRRIGLRTSSVPIDDTVAVAHSLSWTRDPFDRLIVSDAVAANDELLTSDRRIRDHLSSAVW
jgi:PIN domain nuclease of toxin-antitoxin system